MDIIKKENTKKFNEFLTQINIEDVAEGLNVPVDWIIRWSKSYIPFNQVSKINELYGIELECKTHKIHLGNCQKPKTSRRRTKIKEISKNPELKMLSKSFGRNLRKIRGSKTLEEFAKEFGISFPSLWKIEQGGAIYIHLPLLQGLAQRGYKIEDLIYDF